LNIREIEIFRAVMQTGSISRAAVQLGIAQPAASKYIAQLERRLGLALFQRYGNRIVPTPEAKALFDQVDRLFLGLGQVERFMSDLSQLRRGHVTVACLPLLSLTVMPDVVSAFTRERPDVSIALQTRSSARIAEWVAARQVDFGVGIYSSRSVGVTFEPLVELELFCALPPGDTLESRAEIGLSDLQDRDIIALSNHDKSQIALDALLDQHKISPRRRIEVFWTSVALELALRGAGIAFVDKLTAARVPGAPERLRPFRPRLTLDLSLFWPDHWERPAIARALAKEISREVIRRTGG
jgi:DNA-binding transcriptional LysR family regulator